MADVQILAPGVSAAPLSYTVPGSREIILKTLYAEFDGSGAAGTYLPAVVILSPAGQVVGKYRTQESVSAGDSARVTWGPFLKGVIPTVTFPRNVGELGFSGNGAQAATYTHTITFEDVLATDAILVSAQAPSKPSGPGARGVPTGCTDSQGNVYFPFSTHLWEASPPNVNEGAVQQFFTADAPVFPLTAGVDTITVTWDNPVFDRSIGAWLLRHDNGPFIPTELASTADNDAAVFASNQVTLTSPAWTPIRDNSLAFATLFSAKAGGIGGFGGVGGYSGYLQIQGRGFTGSKQSYLINQQTYGANALEVNPFNLPAYEIDLGQLPGGTPVGAFNGVGQFYSAGANAWKGITILAID